MAQVIRSPKVYDVCIIGSGAAGGTAAKILTEGGLNVVMLEAGPQLNPEKDFKEHVWPYQLPHRGAGVGGRASADFGEFLAPNGSWDIEGEPYTVASGSRFRWFRSRIVGGRTNHWGRIALRFAPVDFKARSSDGMGDDWPISYDDVAPYYDKATRSEKKISAKAFVVGASACESARLLLNSKSSTFPDGIANSSGAVGRYLTDSVGSSGYGYFPQLTKMPAHNHDGVGGMHMYMPWWKFDRKNDFLRGYHIEFGGGRGMPGVGDFHGVCEESEGYGTSLKTKCRDVYGAFIGFAGRGEMIPNEQSYCEIDPDTVDQWGIPVLRFHWQWSDNEIKMARDMQETFRDIVETAGGTYYWQVRPDGDHPYGIEDGGVIIHE